MRVSENQLFRTFMDNLERARERFASANQSLASGKKLNRPSDGPADSARIVRIRDEMVRINQYYRSINQARVLSSATDDALNSLRNLIIRISERGAYGLNGILDQASREAIATELEALREEVVRISRLTVDGDYIFSGTLTDTEPIVEVGGVYQYQGNNDARKIEISQADKLQVTALGSDVFTNSSGDLLNSLSSLIDQLRSGDLTAASQSLQEIQDSAAEIDTVRVKLATGFGRLDQARSHLDEDLLRLTRQVIEIEDVDISEAVMKMTQAESALRATLTAGSRLQQPNLFDFLG